MTARLSGRVRVFIDYQNVHFSALSQFHPNGTPASEGHIDPLKLGRELVSKRQFGGELVRVHVYRGSPVPDRQPGPAAANDRQAAVWDSQELVTVHRRPLDYRGDVPREKGIDVQLAVDFVRLALEEAYDVGIMFSRDTDLIPALELVRDRTHAHIEVATWSEGSTRRLSRLQFPGTTKPWCHYLDRTFYDRVRDMTDYTVG